MFTSMFHQRQDTGSMAWVNKYTKRGFTIVGSENRGEASHHPYYGSRWPRDGKTWGMRFSSTFL